MRNVRRHMVSKHGLSQQEVDKVTNKRPRIPAYFTQIYPERIMGAQETSAAAETGSSSSALAASAAQAATLPAVPPHTDAV